MHLKTIAIVAGVALVPLRPASAQAPDRYPVRQMSSEIHQEGFPSWSPDGKILVFENVEKEHYGLFKVSNEGGPPARLTSFIGEHPKWSPDGHYIVFDADFGNSVQVLSAHGGRPIRIVPESYGVSSGGNPLWSPDGTLLAFTSARSGKMDIYVMDLDVADLRAKVKALNE